MPSGWPFIGLCIALRFTEGVGNALFNTAGNTLITQLFPESVGLSVVHKLHIPIDLAFGALANQTERERERERERLSSTIHKLIDEHNYYPVIF